MALHKIDQSKPLCLSPHKGLINRIRTNVRLENLIKQHAEYLAGFGISTLIELWTQAGVPFRQQIDLALGLASMKPRHRQSLTNLFDTKADERHDLNNKLQKARQELRAINKTPFSTFEEMEKLHAQATELKTSIQVLEGKLDRLPHPMENGAIEQCFTQAEDERLVDEKFIAFTGSHSYTYHLTTPTVKLIETILDHRDQVRALVDRRENLDEDSVVNIWKAVRAKIPKPKRIK